MPIPLDVRKKPTSLKVHISTGEGVDIVWADGHASHYDFPYLRDSCPCAMCNDEREQKSKAGAAEKPSAVLPMYKPRVTGKAATPVGNYAIQIQFSDSHATGIFSFGHLREICPCESCAREFRNKPIEATQ
jgi:prepilin-type processing-associated H-X9-DG protein